MDFNRASIDSWTPEEVARFKQRPTTAKPVALALAAAAKPTLVAQGDSWFDYLPGTDIIDCLRNFHSLQIENHSHAGDTLENMVFGGGAPTVISAVNDHKPKALLYSAGGNDVAGDAFGEYLNHKLSGLPSIRPDVATYLIDTAFKQYFERLIAAVAAVSPNTHILVHGYGHTKPTGKAVISFFGFHFIGPWLLPALKTKDILDPNEQINCVFTLIDRYNAMLAGLATAHAHFHYVDLRPLINPDTDWANELHLVNSAFARVSDKIATVIQGL